jgi:4-diphosphocytidyl-2-C-methyl-D-erythritol kinase
MGAGLGGGSSDAAHAVMLLNEVFNLNLSNSQLEQYASKLGSDCAYFIHRGPMIGTGRGEILNTIDVSLKGKFIVVIKPDVHVSTREAYNGVRPNSAGTSITEIIKQHSISDWKDLLVNDFEASVFSQFPIIQKVKEELYNQGAEYASMSGSGSAVFGIFKAKVNLKKYTKDMGYWFGTL